MIARRQPPTNERRHSICQGTNSRSNYFFFTMAFLNFNGEISTGSKEPLEQLEKSLEQGTSKNTTECGTFVSYDDAIRDLTENTSHLKIHDVSEFPDQTTLTCHSTEFLPSILDTDKTDKGSGKVFEQLHSSFQILPPGSDFMTSNVEEFQTHSGHLGLRPRSFSDVSSFPKRGNGREIKSFDREETNTRTVDIFNISSSSVFLKPFHLQDQRRPAFVKTTKNRNVFEEKGGRSYRKEKLHKTMSSSSRFSSRHNHMPVTRSKSFGEKPNDPSRSYNSMDNHGKGGGIPSLRRQALTNAASMSLAIKHPVSHELNQEYRNRMRKPREDNRNQHYKLGKHGNHSRKPNQRLEFIGLVPILAIPGVDTGEVTFCPPNGCKHISITDCPWGSQGEMTLEFIPPTPNAVDLDERFLKTNKIRTYSLPDPPKDEDDDAFFKKFMNLESNWNRRHSSPLSLPSPWSPTSSTPSIWQPSNEANLSPFPLHLSNSAPCTPCHTPVSLNVSSFSDIANTGSTSPSSYGGENAAMFRQKPEEFPQHHPALKRNMSDPPGCSTWHPLRSSLKSPLSLDLESGKHFTYNGQ